MSVEVSTEEDSQIINNEPVNPKLKEAGRARWPFIVGGLLLLLVVYFQVYQLRT
jgi:hypothetical protein